MVARTFTFLGLSRFVHRYLLWFLLGAYALAAVFPGPGLTIRQFSFGALSFSGIGSQISLLLVFLAILMFNAGLGLKTSHLKALTDHK